MNDFRDRAYQRIKLTATLDIATPDGDELLLFNRIENISLGGVCALCSSIEPPGTRLTVILNLQDMPGEIEIPSEVAWSADDPIGCMGIKFLSISEESKEKLKAFLYKKHGR